MIVSIDTLGAIETRVRWTMVNFWKCVCYYRINTDYRIYLYHSVPPATHRDNDIDKHLIHQTTSPRICHVLRKGSRAYTVCVWLH